MPKFIVSVDVGGTKIFSALLDKQGKISNKKMLLTGSDKGHEHVVGNIKKAIEEAIGEHKQGVKAVCLGIAGTVNPVEGMIYVALNLDFSNYNIKQELEKHFNIPVLIENDVNLAGLGIKKFEFGDNIKNMLVVFVGTGIGGALILNGKIHRGSNFFAGEIGRMKLIGAHEVTEGAVIKDFETIASKSAIISNIEKSLQQGKKSYLTNIYKEKGKIELNDIKEAVAQNDKLVVGHIKEAGEVIGKVIGSITTLLNFDTIVLGGGGVEAMGDVLVGQIKKSFSVTVLDELKDKVKIVTSQLGDDAALYGGLALAEEFNLGL